MTTKKNLVSRSNEPVDGHEYVTKMEVSSESAKRKDPFSPAKNAPIVKRKDSGTEGKEGMNLVLEILKQVTDKVDTLGTQLQQNSIMLAGIAKAVEFNAAEIKDCKTQLQSSIREVTALKKDNEDLKERVLELERYKRRWNLRIRGLKEKEGEDIRRREENKTRHVIVQFTQRIHQDALWRMTKDHEICKELRISFIEDLCKADRES
ncbi:hypothetical protein QQF64_023630 [Cirrhinus molitorella]|uniref:Uncharacterized protein n=1 Tax=Cirrhinus molitorella TaxID=172907 RepID=A0ABR3NJL7_9TELE